MCFQLINQCTESDFSIEWFGQKTPLIRVEINRCQWCLVELEISDHFYQKCSNSSVLAPVVLGELSIVHLK